MPESQPQGFAERWHARLKGRNRSDDDASIEAPGENGEGRKPD